VKLLLAYYHPVVFDLALSFKKIFDEVQICVTPDLSDNYGTHHDVLRKGKALGLDCILSNVALLLIKNSRYSLVGVDGVFQGDSLLIDSCRSFNVPYFCINGYPHNVDEPSKNILSLSWFLPQIQYKQRYNNENAVKNGNWREISDQNGLGFDKTLKNSMVFYPEFVDLKSKISQFESQRDCKNPKFVSFIHRFQECNQFNYECFEDVSSNSSFSLTNYTSLSQEDVWKKISESCGLIHLKSADCPGISVLESMILGRVPFVMKDFVLASFDQEVLIDNHSAYVCDTITELKNIAIDHSQEVKKAPPNSTLPIECSTRKHAYMLTDFDRQKRKLENFFNRCLSER
jgi:hypothetical protein